MIINDADRMQDYRNHIYCLTEKITAKHGMNYIKAILEDNILPLKQTTHVVSSFTSGEVIGVRVKTPRIGYEVKYLKTPFTCIGVSGAEYKYFVSPAIARKIAEVFYKLTTDNVSQFVATDNTITCFADELEMYLNRYPETIVPIDIDRFASIVFDFCKRSSMMKAIIKETEHHPQNIKITFFKRLVSMLTRVVQVFSR